MFFVEGAPSVIQSDNGTEFKNLIMKELCEKYYVKQRFSRPRHPQSQGIVERANQTLIRRISKALCGEESRWISILGIFFMIYLLFRFHQLSNQQ